MAPFSVPGILVLPKERKRIGRQKLRASDKMLPPPVRPPPLRLGEEGTTSLLQARSDPLPLLLPPLLLLPTCCPLPDVRSPRPESSASTRIVPLGCPTSLCSRLIPKPPKHPCATMGGGGVTIARLLSGLLLRWRGRRGRKKRHSLAL